MKNNDESVAWEELLSSAARLQKIVPEAVLVGGTAAALFTRHRVSFDADHVLSNLRERFDEILKDLESVAGWETARIRTPVLILGKLDGIDTGIRQLIRSEPLETEKIKVTSEESITVPTMKEILRIKGFLILRRNATRDYLDFVALANGLGPQGVGESMRRFDELYPQKNGESALMQLQTQLANPLPFDLEITNLSIYKHLVPQWRDWTAVKTACIEASQVLGELGELGE